MDANGRLIIDEDGKPKFVGQSFEETGVKEKFKPMDISPEEERRQREAILEEIRASMHEGHGG